MNASIGSLGVVLALVASLLGAITIAVGVTRQRPVLVAAGHKYVPIVLVGALLAVVAMERALLTHDFSLKYVFENNATTTPLAYTIAGMWAALEGSILLWGLVLAGYTVIVWRRFAARRHDPIVAWATIVLLIVNAFFFALMLGPANPFQRLAGLPGEGRGPNPLLQNHPLMAFHPPILYIGYVGFTVPFAFAVAALVTGRVGEGWLLETRRFTLIAWGCLSLGIVLGAWWSYEVIGWAGFWAWDPVENASFLPWLTGTAFIHSVLVQERRGMLRVWNLSLVCATFSLTILGTFLTRSGVIQSVHAFSESNIGPWLLSLFAVVVAVSVGLIGWRGDQLRAPGAIDSPVSREGAFMANNVLFAGFAFVVLLGTVFPLIIEAWNGDRLTIGGPYFDRMTMPIGFVLLFLMAIAPALPWRKASGELLRTRLQWPAVAAVATIVLCVAFGRRGLAPLLTFGLGAFAGGAALRQLVLAGRASKRRGGSWLGGLVGRANGGMIVHLGVVAIAVAIAASRSYGVSREFTVKPGDTVRLSGHSVQYLGVVSSTPKPGQSRVSARLRVDGGRIDEPALTVFPGMASATPTPSVKTGLTTDVYLQLIRAPGDGSDAAVIGVFVQPLILWLWVGGGLVAIGTLLAIVPGRRRRPTDPSTVASATAGPRAESQPDPVESHETAEPAEPREPREPREPVSA